LLLARHCLDWSPFFETNSLQKLNFRQGNKLQIQDNLAISDREKRHEKEEKEREEA